MKNHHLKKSPIVEAVLCLDFAGLSQFNKESVTALMSARFPEYAKEADLHTKSVSFDTAAPSENMVPKVAWTGAKFRKAPNHVLMLSNVDQQVVRLCYSQLAPYKDWESFRGDSLGSLETILSLQPKRPVLKRIGVRFINRMKSPEAGGPMSDFFCVIPKDPLGCGKIALGDFVYRETCYYEKYGLYATTIKCGQHGLPNGDFLIFDADTFSNPNCEWADFSINDFMSHARQLKNDLFFGSVTDMWEGAND